MRNNLDHRLTRMLNNLSPLLNSTSALLEFQMWSDVTSHATLFTCHAQQLVRTALSQSQSGLCQMLSLHNFCWDFLFCCQMICKWYIVLTDMLYPEVISNPLHLKNGLIPILNHQCWWLAWLYWFLVCQFIFKCRLYYSLHQQLSFQR